MTDQTMVIRSVLETLCNRFEREDLQAIESAFYVGLRGFIIQRDKSSTTALSADISPDVRAYQMFFVAKKVEGLSDGTLEYYKYVIDRFLQFTQKPLATITADDIRLYLASREGLSVTTLNNERRNLSSFFGWLTTEEYISKNPMLKIGNIKQPKKIRKPFSADEIEKLRDATTNMRDRAVVETLLSTGMRAGELCGTDKSDVDFNAGEVIVTGKGNKQRICYLNAAAKKRLIDYLESRADNNPALFVALEKPHKRFETGGIAGCIREIGNRAGVDNTHPHRFRRTAATIALQRGMPLDQVRIMLGHEAIATTTLYAITADDAVKYAHAKFM